MHRDFQILQGVEVCKDNQLHDLHNCYDCAGIFVAANRDVLVGFIPNARWGIGQRALTLKFSGVDWLELSPDFEASGLSGIEQMGFKSPHDRDYEWLLREEQSSKEDHMVFRFIEGDILRIHSSEAFLLVGSSLFDQIG